MVMVEKGESGGHGSFGGGDSLLGVFIANWRRLSVMQRGKAKSLVAMKA